MTTNEAIAKVIAFIDANKDRKGGADARDAAAKVARAFATIRTIVNSRGLTG